MFGNINITEEDPSFINLLFSNHQNFNIQHIIVHLAYVL
jgi:hypothetical protein